MPTSGPTAAGTPVRSPAGFGRALRAARRAAGLTQAELAERARTNRQTIVSLESGHDTRAVELLFDALSALNLEFVVRHRDAQ